MRRLLFGVSLCTRLVLAQTNAGQITGTVTDSQQSAVAGAKVAATNLATNVQQTAVSSSVGLYVSFR
jgi:hypothetical protein